MTRLDDTIARGNRGHRGWSDDSLIRCADGFTVSVIAGGGTYCSPRPALCSHYAPSLADTPATYGLPHEVRCDYPGPYLAVEVGFPSEAPEPTDEWERYGDLGGVYGNVPVEMVRALVALHGGEVS